MQTTAYASTPTEDDEEGIIPFLVVQGSDRDLEPSTTVPLSAPILKPVEKMDAISLPELEEAQAFDTWCQDMLCDMEETRGTRSLQEYL